MGVLMPKHRLLDQTSFPPTPPAPGWSSFTQILSIHLVASYERHELRTTQRQFLFLATTLESVTYVILWQGKCVVLKEHFLLFSSSLMTTCLFERFLFKRQHKVFRVFNFELIKFANYRNLICFLLSVLYTSNMVFGSK